MAAAPLRIEHVDTFDALDTRAAEWDELAASLPQALPMLAHPWVSTLFAQRLAEGERWFCLFAYDGDDLVGVLPLVAASTKVMGLPRTRLRVPCAYNTEDGDVLLAPGHAQAALRALLKEARRRTPRLLGLDLGSVRDSSPTIKAIEAGVGWIATRGPANLGSAIAIEGDIETWRAGMGKSMRRDLRRGPGRLERDHGEATYEALEGADATPERLAELTAVEASGWKGREGGAIAADDSRERRYEAMAEGFAARGWLEWHFLRVGDRVAAAHMGVRVGRSLMLLRHVFDESMSRCGPGHLLMEWAALREFESGRSDEINIVNDYAWCRRWGMRQSHYYRYQLTPRRPLALALGAGPGLVRSAARRVPGMRRFVRWIKRADD